MSLPQTINLQPIINTPTKNLNYNLNSFFLYIFAIFEIIIVILIFNFFYRTELIFIYNLIFNNNSYNNEDKKTYNNFMTQIKKIIETPKSCKKINNSYYPIYDNDKNMLALNGDILVFNNIEKCNSFLNST